MSSGCAFAYSMSTIEIAGPVRMTPVSSSSYSGSVAAEDTRCGRDQKLVRIGCLRILVGVLHVRVRGRAVEIEVSVPLRPRHDCLHRS